MKKPGRQRIERIATDVSFSTSWNDVLIDHTENTYLEPLLRTLQEAERAFERALEAEMAKHDVEYS